MELIDYSRTHLCVHKWGLTSGPQSVLIRLQCKCAFYNPNITMSKANIAMRRGMRNSEFYASFLHIEYWRIEVIIKTGTSHAKPGEARTIRAPCAPTSARTCCKTQRKTLLCIYLS